MARIKTIICLLIALFAFKAEVKAQDSTSFYGMNWYLKKSVALDAARSQGKQIFLLWGRESCPDCQWVKERLSEAPFNSIVNENYVLWFSDSNTYGFDSEEVGDYLTALKGLERHFIPVLCVIDSFDLTVPSGFKYGPDFALKNEANKNKTAQYYDEMLAMLNEHVSNDIIYSDNVSDAIIYVADNNLTIKSKSADEIVSVFALAGSIVDRFHKTEYDITRDLSKYPKGILVVTGSSGWSKKITIK